MTDLVRQSCGHPIMWLTLNLPLHNATLFRTHCILCSDLWEQQLVRTPLNHEIHGQDDILACCSSWGGQRRQEVTAWCHMKQQKVYFLTRYIYFFPHCTHVQSTVSTSALAHRKQHSTQDAHKLTCLGLAFFLQHFVSTPSPTNTRPGLARD